MKKWAYGVTTVPGRFCDLLPQTLASLEKAGFDSPRLFVDGCREGEVPQCLRRYEMTCHYPAVRTFGNWYLGLTELYLRKPNADMFAMFQDDFVTYPTLREYLEVCQYPKQGYWNLYTFPENVRPQQGWYLSGQKGKGAVALVFSRECAMILLEHRSMVGWPQNLTQGYKGLDGRIVTSMKKIDWHEYVHNPSLVQHTGLDTSIADGRHPKQPLSPVFRGEDYDALNLLGESQWSWAI